MDLFSGGNTNKIEILHDFAHHRLREGIRGSHPHRHTCSIPFDYFFLLPNVFNPLLLLLPFLCVSDDGKVVFDLFSCNNSRVEAAAYVGFSNVLIIQ